MRLMTILHAYTCTHKCCNYYAGDNKPPYERCTTAVCTSTPGVTVYSRRDSTTPFDMFTIFEIADGNGKGGSKARYLLNRGSTVRLGTSGFVSGPRKGNALAASVCKHGGWTGTLVEAQAKCEADDSCGFVHDSDCDGRGWRYCSGSADQQATGDALACIKVRGEGAKAMSYSFRNPPNFMPLAGETYYGFDGFNSAFREPQVCAVVSVLSLAPMQLIRIRQHGHLCMHKHKNLHSAISRSICKCKHTSKCRPCTRPRHCWTISSSTRTRPRSSPTD